MTRQCKCSALLALLCLVALARLSDAAVPASAAVLQGADVPAGECRVRYPNTCLCRQGSCAGCDHCAGCADHLCVGLPLGSDAVAELQMDDASAATDPTKNVGAVGRSLKVSVASANTASVTTAAVRPVEGKPDTISGKVPIPGYRVTPVRKTTTNVRVLDNSVGLICDGTIRNLTVPLAPYGTEPPYATYTLDGLPLSCNREAGGPCGSQEKVQCLPYSDNIGPITQSGEYGLFIRPDNPLVFKITNASIFLTYLNWTVYDVGTGGAKLAASYGSGSLAPVEITHEWQPNGPQAGGVDESGATTYYCGACTDCVVGDGIQAMSLSAGDGLGFTSFALSQLYEDVRCGATCFDLDASYWTGMEYSCVTPTCADTDLNTEGKQAFTCTPEDMYITNPLAGANSTLSVDSCCLLKTCSNTKPDEALSTNKTTPYACPDGFIYNMDADEFSPPTQSTCCIQFTPTCGNQDPLVPDVKFNCSAIGFFYNSSAADVPAVFPQDFLKCCSQSPDPADSPDVYVLKSVEPTSVQNVGDIFTFTIEVGLNGLNPATDVVMIDNMPDQLTILSVESEPETSACTTDDQLNQILCSWDSIDTPTDIKTITVTTRINEAGTWLNPAIVTAPNDSDPTNNKANATVSARGACCTIGTGTCANVLPSQCVTGTFTSDKACDLVNCRVDPPQRGACCIKATGRCQDNISGSICQQAGGQFYQDQACSEIACGRTPPPPPPPPPTELGACCNRQTGSCEEGVREGECDGQWAAGGTCRADGFCTGACCETSTGSCEQSLKKDCDYSWSIYQECSPDVCPTKCIPNWYQCQPPKQGAPDPCCPGSACSYTYKGCPTGEYVCKPIDNCVPDGYPCGGNYGGYCCKGMTCVWDHKKKGGVCRSSGGCVPDGGFCGKKGFCCRGSYNNGGRCVGVDYNSCYKKCKSYECYLEKQRNCAVLRAAAAST